MNGPVECPLKVQWYVGFHTPLGKPVEGRGAQVHHSLTYHMSVVRLMRRGFPHTTGKPVEGSGAPVHLSQAYHMSVGRLLSQTIVTLAMPQTKTLVFITKCQGLSQKDLN